MPGPGSGIAAASALGANLDIVRLFQSAHWIVQAVMVVLAIMFVIGLYIIIYKTMYLSRATGESTRFTDSFWKSRDIEQIYKQAQALRNSPISQMFVAGYTELAKLSSDETLKGDREGSLASIERALRRAQTVETGKLDSMISFLATTGSAAPFIGLLGTVMGILFAFIEISEATGAANSVILEANAAWIAPGHNAIATDKNGDDWIVYHAVDAKRSRGAPRLLLLTRLLGHSHSSIIW